MAICLVVEIQKTKVASGAMQHVGIYHAAYKWFQFFLADFNQHQPIP